MPWPPGTNDKNAAICVTTGLLTLLDREETQGVVAHEMSHIRNEDILLMTLVSILLGGIAILADFGQRGFYSARSGRRLGQKSPLIFFAVDLADRLVACDRPAVGDGGVAPARVSRRRQRGAVHA